MTLTLGNTTYPSSFRHYGATSALAEVLSTEDNDRGSVRRGSGGLLGGIRRHGITLQTAAARVLGHCWCSGRTERTVDDAMPRWLALPLVPPRPPSTTLVGSRGVDNSTASRATQFFLGDALRMIWLFRFAGMVAAVTVSILSQSALYLRDARTLDGTSARPRGKVARQAQTEACASVVALWSM